MNTLRALAGWLALGCIAFSASAFGADKIVWGHINATAFYWDMYAAVDQGFMAAQKIEVEPVRIDAASQSIQMVLTGAVDILSSNTELALKAIDKGADLVIIGNEAARVPWSLMARPEIKSIGDLKGKIIGVTQLQDASTTMTQLLLQKGGLKPGDYEMIQVGGTPTRYAALVRGAVQATVLAQPQDFVAADAGMRKLGGVQDAFEGPAIVFVARKSWAQKNPELVTRFLRGALEGMRWLNDPKNRNDAIRLLAKRINATEDHARATYDMYIQQKVISPDGALPMAHIKNYLALSSESPPADLSKYVNFTYLDRARASAH